MQKKEWNKNNLEVEVKGVGVGEEDMGKQN